MERLQLSVHIVEARNIPKPKVHRTLNVYVTVNLNSSRLLQSELSTNPIRHHCPRWDNSFTYFVENLKTDIVQVKLYAKHKIRAASLLGHVNIPIFDFLDHPMPHSISNWYPILTETGSASAGELHIEMRISKWLCNSR